MVDELTTSLLPVAVVWPLMGLLTLAWIARGPDTPEEHQMRNPFRRHRSAESGQYVTPAEAAANPATTVTESDARTARAELDAEEREHDIATGRLVPDGPQITEQALWQITERLWVSFGAGLTPWRDVPAHTKAWAANAVRRVLAEHLGVTVRRG